MSQAEAKGQESFLQWRLELDALPINWKPTTPWLLGARTRLLVMEDYLRSESLSADTRACRTQAYHSVC